MKALKQAGIIAISLIISGNLAAGERYENPRFEYAIELPDHFSTLTESWNSDGGVSKSYDQKSELRVFGAYILDGSFSNEVMRRKASSISDGWALSYTAAKKASASYSGTKSGNILYVRMLQACAGSTAVFELVYPEEQKKSYDAVVQELVSTFRTNKENC